MTTGKRRFGDLGEDAAAAHLTKNGYKIRARNLVIGKREIDIVAEDREHLVFVEVKTRTYSPATLEKYGRACMAVNAEKRKNLLLAAAAYISDPKNKPRGKALRFDVVEVYFDTSDPPALISLHHMPDAFRSV